MTKWEPRCPKCGCWRGNSKGYCIHKCEYCKGKTSDEIIRKRKDVQP